MKKIMLSAALLILAINTYAYETVSKCFKEYEKEVTLGQYEIHDGTYLIAASVFARPGRPLNKLNNTMLSELSEVLDLKHVGLIRNFKEQESKHMHVYMGKVKGMHSGPKILSILRSSSRLSEINNKYFGLLIDCWPKILKTNLSNDSISNQSQMPIEFYLEQILE